MKILNKYKEELKEIKRVFYFVECDRCRIRNYEEEKMYIFIYRNSKYKILCKECFGKVVKRKDYFYTEIYIVS